MFKVFKTKAADGLSFENADLKLQKKKKKRKRKEGSFGTYGPEFDEILDDCSTNYYTVE